MNDDKQLRWSRRLAVVPRWQIAPVLRRQSVAEHSFHVAHTALWLLQFSEGKDAWTLQSGENTRILPLESEVILYALTHDIDEAAKGDAPSSSKPAPDYSEWPQVKIIVKVADILEAMAFLFEEQLMGNAHFTAEIFIERQKALEKVWVYFNQSERWPGMSADELWHKYREALFVSHPGLEDK